MKRSLLISGAFAALFAVAACGEKAEVVEDGPVENASAESGVGSNPVSNAAQDAASAAVGAASAVTAGRTTAGFVGGAANGDMFEIESSRIAAEKAQNPQVKQFAQRMIEEHTKSSADLKAAVQGAGDVTIPAAMDERRQGMVDNLRQAPAANFDQVYIGQQIAAHQENVELHQTYAENGDNAALKALAAKHLPMIQQHLQQARALGEASGGGQGGSGGQGGGSASR
jgi:putative membrane protein